MIGPVGDGAALEEETVEDAADDDDATDELVEGAVDDDDPLDETAEAEIEEETEVELRPEEVEAPLEEELVPVIVVEPADVTLDVEALSLYIWRRLPAPQYSVAFPGHNMLQSA